MQEVARSKKKIGIDEEHPCFTFTKILICLYASEQSNNKSLKSNNSRVVWIVLSLRFILSQDIQRIKCR